MQIGDYAGKRVVGGEIISDEVTERLAPEIKKAAEFISDAGKEKNHVLIRFHNDADGVCGGIAIAKVVGGRYTAIQNNSAVYRMSDAMRDAAGLKSESNSLLILIDFGANDESIDSLEMMKAAGIEIIIIDHHPPNKKVGKLVSLFVSPWNAGGDSDYSAGFLCSEIAREAGLDAEEIGRISLAGDKSGLYEPSEEEVKKALVLDYVASYGGFPNTINFYESILAKKSLFLSLYSQASDKIENAFSLAKANTKVKEVGNFKIALVAHDKATKHREFPGKGKAVGLVFDDLKGSGPFVAIGHGKRVINFRANREAVDAGFNATELIREIKKELKEAIISGGGHSVAASMRVEEGYSKVVLEEVLKRIGEI